MRFLLLPAALLATTTPALAEQDGQGWAAVTASGAVKGDLFLWAEGQARLTDEFGGGLQTILRPAIGARIGPDAHAVAGYAWVRTDPEAGVTTHEHRLWQQVQFVPVRLRGAPLVISRTRLEQRMVEGRRETGWRLRQFVRAQAPVGPESAGLQLVGWSEGFVNLNGTDWNRGGLDQWRNFIGIGLPLGPRARIEPGYMNQHVFRAGEDRTNHIASATVFYRF